ncbi:MAG: anti-sigma factor family protein [Gemmatimonadales bacterium]
MNDHWTDRLSAYVDGALARAERESLEGHLAGCADCRAVLDDLHRVVARARALEDRAPARNLWPRIAARLTPFTPVRRASWMRRRLTFTAPQLAAAAVVLVVASAGSVMMLLPKPPDQGATTPGPSVSPVGLIGAMPRYDAAVAQLEAALVAGRGRLDTATVRIIEKNLAIIDSAIADSRRALARDPGNAYLNHHLAGQMRRKLELLRRANALAVRG